MAASRILENAGNVSKTMLEVGYAPSTAKNPQELTESKGWKELMEEQLPDSLLAEKHNELLTVPKITRTRRIGAEYEETEETIDTQAISKGLDMAYKLKGHYAPEKADLTSKGERLENTNDISMLAAEVALKLKDNKTNESADSGTIISS